MARKHSRSRQSQRDRKRRAREKKKSQERVRSAELQSPVGRLRRAAKAPLLDCLISEGWRESGLATILLSRDAPDGIAAAVFLVDVDCLGVKNCFAVPDLSLEQYQALEERIASDDQALLDCEPALARKIVETAVAFASGLGFRPNSDYARARMLFGDIDPRDASEEVECGRDGSPLYVAGPHDDVDGVLRTLQKTVGEDELGRRRNGESSLFQAVLESLIESQAAANQPDATRARSPRASALHDRAAKLVQDILAFSVERHGEALIDDAWYDFTDLEHGPADAESSARLFTCFADWLLFSWLPEASDYEGPAASLAGEYVAERNAKLDPLEKSWIEALLHAPRSFYSAIERLDDETLILENLMTGAKVEVLDPVLASVDQPGMILFGRVLEVPAPMDAGAPFDGDDSRVSIMIGSAPAVFPPRVRRKLERIRETISEALGAFDDTALHELDSALRAVYFGLIHVEDHVWSKRSRRLTT